MDKIKLFVVFNLWIQWRIKYFYQNVKLSLLYVDDTYIITTYETFKDKKYINSLHYSAQQDNISEYKKIIKHKFKPELPLNEIIKIDRRYLLSLNENLDNNNDVLINNINKSIESADIETFSLKSPYDTGKTQLIKQIR